MERYRLREPTLALFDEDGRRVARALPAGTTLVVDHDAGSAAADDTVDSRRMVGILWDGIRVMMFIEDLRSRGELMDLLPIGSPKNTRKE